MSSDKKGEIAPIVEQCNRNISRILKIAKSIEPDNADLERVTRLVKIIRYENPPHVLERCVDKFWDNKDKIMNRDIDFFVNNIQTLKEKYIKKDIRQSWMEGMTDYIKNNLNKLSEEDMTYIWDCLNNILKCVIQYKLIIIGDA